MTPQEKSNELVEKYHNLQIEFTYRDSELRKASGYMTHESAKQCAKIAVNEIVENGFNPQLQWNFWQDVLTEIDKL